MRIDHMCKKAMVFGVSAVFFIVGSLAGCASDGRVSPSGIGKEPVSAEAQDVSEKESKRKKLTLDDGRRGKPSPALKNQDPASPPGGPPSSPFPD